MNRDQKHRRTYLTLVCILILLVLTAIHGYLTFRVYTVSRDAYFDEVLIHIHALKKEEVMARPLDNSIKFMAALLTPYLKGETPKRGILEKFNAYRKKQKQVEDENLSNKLRSDLVLKNVDYSMQFEAILASNNGKIDTIFLNKKHPIILLGREMNRHSQTLLNVSRDTAGFEITAGGTRDKPRIRYKYNFLKAEYVDVAKWKEAVIVRMTVIFVLAFILVASIISIVLYLLWAIYKEKQLVQLQTDFTNNINHELNTPLSSIAINIKNLTRDDIYHDRAAYEAQINLLQRQYLKLRNIVDQVLESDAGRFPEPKIRWLNITDYLHDMVTEIELPYHPFSVEIESDQAMLNTDVNIVEKVIDQLLENATKYSETGKEIALKAFKEEGFFCIAVSDQGRGISKEHQRMIFNKFYRVPTRNERNIKGLGIGLYIARISLRQINAQLVVQSQPDIGSVFTIKIPII